MKRISPMLDLSAYSVGYPLTVRLGEESETNAVEEPGGWHHLLENHTLSQVKEVMRFPFAAFEVSRIFDQGVLPDDEFTAAQFVLGMLKLDEPKVAAAIFRSKDISIPIHTADHALALLDVINLNPAASFSNVSLHVFLQNTNEVGAMLVALTQLLTANRGINKIRIRFCKNEDYRLEPFFVALSGIARLRLMLDGDSAIMPQDVSHLLALVSANKSIHTLRLDNLRPATGPGPLQDSYVRLLSLLKAQTQLEEFSFSSLTQGYEEILGDLLCGSQSLKSLSIRLHPGILPSRLMAGLERNTSLETLILDIGAIMHGMSRQDDGIHPLIDALRKNNCSFHHLRLDMVRCPADSFSTLFNARQHGKNKRSFIADLLAGNSNLNMLSLQLPNGVCVDLLPIAERLEHNHSLEKLHIGFGSASSEKSDGDGSFNLSTFPAFVKKLARNWTLRELTTHNAGGHDGLFRYDHALASILERNASFQKYACSRAYFNGVATSFFEALGLPSDPATVFAKCLETQRPRSGARALALVNKVTNKRALDARSLENAANFRRIIGELPGSGCSTPYKMWALLTKMAVTRPDISDADLRRIADSDVLAPALVALMDDDTPGYLYLAKRFCDVAGPALLRKQFASAFPRPADLTRHRLAMLEQTFQPDQGHLACPLDKELDYRSIGPIELKFFAGYNVVFEDGFRPHLLMDDVIAWCIERELPELYLAYAGNFPETLTETQTMPAGFRQRFLSLIPLSQKIKRLLVRNAYREEDERVLEPLLSDGSGLRHLYLDNFHCSAQYFDSVMDKINRNTELRHLRVYLPESQRPFPVIEKIRETLRNNLTLGALVLKLPPEHEDLPLLQDLCRIDRRLDIKTRYPAYLSYESDDGEDSSDSSAEESTESERA